MLSKVKDKIITWILQGLSPSDRLMIAAHPFISVLPPRLWIACFAMYLYQKFNNPKE